VVVELLQLLMHREASVVDIVRDFAGIVVGLSLYASIDPELRIYSLMSEKRLRAGVIML
jgi:VanZ family protein